MGTKETHPVYIDKNRKSDVKSEAVQLETSMKEVTERLVGHGMAIGLHKVPLDQDVDFEVVNVGTDDNPEYEVTLQIPSEDTEDDEVAETEAAA